MPEEIITKIDEALSGIKEVQDTCTRNSGRLDVLDELKIDKINEVVTKNYEEVATMKAKQDKIEESLVNLEKTLNRPSEEKSDKKISKESEVAFVKYLRNRAKELTPEALTEITEATVQTFYKGVTKDEIAGHVKDMVVGINPSGGYFVRPEFANFMIERQFETSPMRQIANVQTTSAESLQIPIDDDEAGATWVGEVDSRSSTTTPTIGQLEIHTHELYASPPVSQKLLDDAAFDIETWLQNKLADIFTRAENTAFVNGDGSKRPRGFLTYSAWTTPGTYERGKLEIRNSGTAGSFSTDNLIKLQTDLYEFYQSNATWVMQRKTFADVMQLKDKNDNYLLNFQMLAQGSPLIILGRPVRFFDDMQAVATDALAIAYGDFRLGYTIADRLGIRVLVDPYTGEPFILYKTRKRVGGDVTNYQSIKILKLSA